MIVSRLTGISRRSARFALLVTATTILVACSASTPYFKAKKEPWRADSEMACLRSGVVMASTFQQPASRLNGPSVCGAIRPYRLRAVSGGTVRMQPAALLRCPMVPAVERWMRDSVQPAAMRHFGVPIRTVSVLASYSCRPRNNKRGAKLSEHGFANALDVGGFILADGRTVKVKDGWRAADARSRFLRAVHRGACRSFTTVIGPNADRYHQDHFHLDLARHNPNNSYRYCR